MINVEDLEYRDGGLRVHVVQPSAKEMFTNAPLVDNVTLFPALADYDNPNVYKVVIIDSEKRRVVKKGGDLDFSDSSNWAVAAGVTLFVPFGFIFAPLVFETKDVTYEFIHYTAKVYKRTFKPPVGWIWTELTQVEFDSDKTEVKKPTVKHSGKDSDDIQAEQALDQLADIIWEARHDQPEDKSESSSSPNAETDISAVSMYAADLPDDQLGPRFIPRTSVNPGQGYFSKISEDEVLIGKIYSSKTLSKYARNSTLKDEAGNKLSGNFMIVGFETDNTRMRYIKSFKEYTAPLPYSSIRLLSLIHI